MAEANLVQLRELVGRHCVSERIIYFWSILFRKIFTFARNTRLSPKRYRPKHLSTLAFRALRLTGLAVGLGLSAFTAYHRSQAQMSSQDHHHGHLDATTGREVVYCHACSGEWYRNEHGLECQECGSEITEMV